MGRILALDIGEKTIGIALSDETETLATPGKTLLRHEGKRKDAAAIRDLAQAHNVQAIVVGLPLRLDGSKGIQAAKTEDFVATLRNYVRTPIRFQDERLSTWEAEQPLLQAGLSRQERKKVVDSRAAAIILQDYLDAKRAPAAPEAQA